MPVRWRPDNELDNELKMVASNMRSGKTALNCLQKPYG